MKTAEFSHGMWQEISECLTSLRKEIYESLLLHGPVTTRELAELTRIDILTVRPRVTELCQAGLARLAERQTSKTEGRYEAVSIEDAMTARVNATRSGQLELRLNA